MGDGTQVCASLGFITTKLGMHFVHYGPEGHQLLDEHNKIMEENCRESGGTWDVTDDRVKALTGADFITQTCGTASMRTRCPRRSGYACSTTTR